MSVKFRNGYPMGSKVTTDSDPPKTSEKIADPTREARIQLYMLRAQQSVSVFAVKPKSKREVR